MGNSNRYQSDSGSSDPPPPYAESSDQQPTTHQPNSPVVPGPPISSSSSVPPTIYQQALLIPPQPSKQYPHRLPIHTITIPSCDPPNERVALMNDASERRFPLAAIFFLLGWFCPPFWFIGACCCAASPSKYENWWGRLNLLLAITTLITSIIYSMVTLSKGHWTLF